MTSFDFRLPDVGEGIAEAEVIEWLVAVGDEVNVDQPVAVLETDKSQIEMPTPVAGRVIALGGRPGDLLRVGAVVVTIETTAVHPAPVAAAPHASTPLPAVTVGQVSSVLGRVQASPSTRKLAAQLGIDVTTVTGSGPNGRVTAEDVQAAAARPVSVTPSVVGQPSAVSGRATTRGLHGLRRSIAAAMTQALSVPDIMEFREIDASALLQARDSLAAQVGVAKLSVTPLLMRATVVALQRHPSFNARFDAQRGEVTEYESVHLGVATATDDGLIVPVLHDAQAASVAEIIGRVDRLTAAARARTVTPEELAGGTFTVTNFGSFGTWLGTPIIRVPEVAIAGFGRIAERAVVVSGSVVARATLPVVVAADHRVNDGAHLGAFVTTLEHLITHPQELMT